MLFQVFDFIYIFMIVLAIRTECYKINQNQNIVYYYINIILLNKMCTLNTLNM